MHRSKPRRPLVEVVRRVAGEVGQLAVGPDQHPVLVVAEVGGAHPDRTVGVEHVALAAQLLQAVGHGGVGVQRPLREPDVEVGAEGVERRLLLRELDPVAGLPERDRPFIVGQVEDARLLGEHLLRDVVDVRALVAVLRHRLALRPGLDRGAELVHLRPAVVDVELPLHAGTGRVEHPGQRVADRGPPGVAEVQRPGRVGRDELDVDPLAGERVVAAVRRPGREHVCRDLSLGPGRDRDVEEPRPRDVDGRDPVRAPQPLGDQLGEGPRVGARLLRQLERDVGRVVPVLLAARTLDHHRGGDAVGQADGAVVDERLEDADDGRRELFGGHRPSVSAWAGPSHGDIGEPIRGRPVGSGSLPSHPMSPCSSGDRAPPSGGGSAGSNPARGA